MLYRENGQFKASYEEDQQILPIVQDRWFMLALLAFALPGGAGDRQRLPVPVAILIPFLILAIAAIGLNILVGYCGQISLGTAPSWRSGPMRPTTSGDPGAGAELHRRAGAGRRHRRPGRHRVRHPEPAHQGAVPGGRDPRGAVLHRLDVRPGQVVHQLFLVWLGVDAGDRDVRLDHGHAGREVPVRAVGGGGDDAGGEEPRARPHRAAAGWRSATWTSPPR
jgi:hypothetical protein